MKTKVIFLTGMFITVVSFAQIKTVDVHIALETTEVTPPKFCVDDKVIQGECFESINEFLNKNIVYPTQSARCKYQGTELVKFTVTPTGELDNFEIINSVCKKMDEEVIRTLKLTNGMWTPAYINGNAVAMDKEVSVVFALHSSNNFVKMAKNYIKRGNNLLFEKNNPKRALKYYDMGIILIPNNETLLAARGLCRFELGDEEGASRDWERLKIVVGKNEALPKTELLANNFTELSGYTQMIETLNK